MAWEVFEHGFDAGRLKAAGKGCAILTGLRRIGGEGAVPHHFEPAAVDVEDRGEIHVDAVCLEHAADLRADPLHILRAAVCGHLLRGRECPEDFGEALHAAAFKINGDLEVAVQFLSQGHDVATLFGEQIWVRPAGDEDAARAGFELLACVVVVDGRRHEQGGRQLPAVRCGGRGAGLWGSTGA